MAVVWLRWRRCCGDRRIVVVVFVAVSKDPSLVNTEPPGTGWLFEIQASNPAEKNALMTLEGYEKFIKENPH